MTFKFGVIVGHTSAAGGATGIGLPTEYRYNKSVAQDMQEYCKQRYGNNNSHNMEIKIFFRDNGGVINAYKSADHWGAKATVELHYNAAIASARGTETLSSGSSESLKLAGLVQSGMCELLSRSGNSRGVKIRNRQNKERGWLSLVTGQAPAIITEPAFGSNGIDAALLRSKQFDIGRSIVDKAYSYSL